MNIQGFNKLTLLDYPGLTACTVFTGGCDLRCPFCHNASLVLENPQPQMTQEELLAFLKKRRGILDGVCVTGGEPLLHPEFIRDFRAECGQNWHLCAETSLAVPWENVQTAAGCIDMFYVDCKDTDSDIYRRYTGRENARMLENLQKLVDLVGPERVCVRLPLIPEFNTDGDRDRSQALLEGMGIRKFDRFLYRTGKNIL